MIACYTPNDGFTVNDASFYKNQVKEHKTQSVFVKEHYTRYTKFLPTESYTTHNAVSFQLIVKANATTVHTA